MKIKSVVAVGAMGVGLGLAGLIGGTATASADCSSRHPNPDVDRARLPREPRHIATLSAASVSPRYQRQIGTFASTSNAMHNPIVSMPR